MKKLLIILIAVLSFIISFPINAALADGVPFRNDMTGALTAGNGGPWGGWSRAMYCPPNSWASGYTMRVEAPLRDGDDTAMNAIALYCSDSSGSDSSGRRVGRVVADEGLWGDWREGAQCPTGTFMTHFQLKVEPPQGDGDDTAANSAAFWCGNQRIEAAGGNPWGGWGNWKGSPANSAICGVRTKLEPSIGSGDDTALNDIEIFWCSIPNRFLSDKMEKTNFDEAKNPDSDETGKSYSDVVPRA